MSTPIKTPARVQRTLGPHRSDRRIKWFGAIYGPRLLFLLLFLVIYLFRTGRRRGVPSALVTRAGFSCQGVHRRRRRLLSLGTNTNFGLTAYNQLMEIDYGANCWAGGGDDGQLADS